MARPARAFGRPAPTAQHIKAMAQCRVQQFAQGAYPVAPDPETLRIEMNRRRELLTMPQAAAKLGYGEGKSAARAAYEFLRRHRLLIKRGNAVLAYVGEIEDVLDSLRTGGR